MFFLSKLNKIFPFCQTVTFVKSRKLINKNTISLLSKLNVSEIHNKINIANLSDTSDVRITLYSPICDNNYKVFLVKNASNAIVLILNTMQSVDY